MSTTVTLNIQSGNNTSKGSINVADKKLLNCIFPNMQNNTITEAEFKHAQDVARRAGDKGIIEKEDLQTATDKLELAKLNKYGDMYDLSLSDDKKYFIIKVKDSTVYPRLGGIKDDFGIRDGYFVPERDRYSPTYNKDNAELLSKRHEIGSDGIVHADYDEIRLEPGDVLKIPVEEIQIQDGVSGNWGRFWKGLVHPFTR